MVGANGMNKQIKRRIRELAGVAHERALDAALRDLAREFDRWREGGIDAFDLNDRIHQFHQKIARKLYSYYTGAESDLIVAAAVTQGLIDRKEVGDEVLRELERLIQSLAEPADDREN
jgi:hypothetical protein